MNALSAPRRDPATRVLSCTTLWRVAFSALLLSACASTKAVVPSPATGETSSGGASTASEPPHDSQPAVKHPAPVPADVVERAALPFYGLRIKDGTRLVPENFFSEVARADAICVGEEHDNPHDHFSELYLIQALGRRAQMTGRELGLGLEMFQAPFQPVLNAYAAGRIDQAQFLKQTEYKKRWGFPFAYYRPQIEQAIKRGFSLLALNAPAELTHAIAKHGLAGLDEKSRSELPKLDLTNRRHRALFNSLMKHHPTGIGKLEHLYEAQVVWDETMAQNAADWLEKRRPARQLIILAGLAHCDRSGIVSRLKRRTGLNVINVRPLVTPAESVDRLDTSGYDYAFVMVPPSAATQ